MCACVAELVQLIVDGAPMVTHPHFDFARSDLICWARFPTEWSASECASECASVSASECEGFASGTSEEVRRVPSVKRTDVHDTLLGCTIRKTLKTPLLTTLCSPCARQRRAQLEFSQKCPTTSSRATFKWHITAYLGAVWAVGHSYVRLDRRRPEKISRFFRTSKTCFQNTILLSENLWQVRRCFRKDCTTSKMRK